MATKNSNQPKTAAKQRAVTIGTARTISEPGVKTSGIKIRGTGAAKRGITARGPMA